jgi:L-asparaginase II
MLPINPVIAEILRGRTVESFHRGSFAVVDGKGHLLQSTGDISKPIFPRSAIKAFQCAPLLDSGAATAFALTDEEIALCCASHSGEADHVRVARSILDKAAASETDYECGAHWPERMDDRAALIKAGELPRAVHNNCSGKHAGMLALAKHIGAPLSGYVTNQHPVQQMIAKTLGQYCAVDIAAAASGIDGCSVPTWAVPLQNLAHGFAKLFARENETGQRIAAAVRAYPFMVAGTGKFDTRVMQAVPRLFIKVGAEGVYCGAVPHAEIGFALKMDDGAVRGAEVAIASVLAGLDCWSGDEKQILKSFSYSTMHNWRKLEVGETRASF